MEVDILFIQNTKIIAIIKFEKYMPSTRVFSNIIYKLSY